VTETKIYIGLNDSVEKKQLFETERYVKVLRGVCSSYKTPFSFTMAEGGYIHENGEYTREKTLIINLIDTKREIVNGIARDLCVLFHQESVMITENLVRTYYVKERLE